MTQLLGRGPVAEVYAVDGNAVKVFPGRFDRRTLATIERERAKLAEVPAVRVHGVELHKGRHALRMELCVDSLASRVRRDGPLPSEEVAVLCGSLSNALSVAHGLGVLHGGVSPLNVLFRESGEAVLADFGVAQRQAFRRDPLYGIEWVSPETLRTGEVDAKTDLYGLGAVLHFALTGESPHPSRIGETTGERILRVLGDPVPAVSRPDVPIGLSTAIGRLLAPDPAKRSAPTPAGDVPEPRSPSRARHWRWAAATAVVLVAALAFVLWPRPTPSPPANASPRTAPAAVIEIVEITDLGEQVSLTWTTTDERLYFGVVYWAAGEKSDTRLAARARTMSVPVEPGRGYCFLVRGTDGDRVVVSRPRAVREAVCTT
jgi:serine/threonine protein kinase